MNVRADGHACELHGWKELGMVSTSCAMFAIVDARGGAGVEPAMDRLWFDVVEHRGRAWPTFESFEGPGKHGFAYAPEHGMFLGAPDNGGYRILGRFTDLHGTGHMSLAEVRILFDDDEGDTDVQP